MLKASSSRLGSGSGEAVSSKRPFSLKTHDEAPDTVSRCVILQVMVIEWLSRIGWPSKLAAHGPVCVSYRQLAVLGAGGAVGLASVKAIV